jgi:hypothetical protein
MLHDKKKVKVIILLSCIEFKVIQQFSVASALHQTVMQHDHVALAFK